MHARGKPLPRIPRGRDARRAARSGHSRSNASSRSSRARAAARRASARSRRRRRPCSRSWQHERAPLRHDRHRRAAEHRQVEPAQPPRGREALDRLAQAADHAPPGHRHPDARATASTSSSMRRASRRSAKSALHRRLNRRATEAARDADVALFVVEALRFGADDQRGARARFPPSSRSSPRSTRSTPLKNARAADPVPRPPVEDARLRGHRAGEREDRQERPRAAAPRCARRCRRGRGVPARPAHRPRRALLRRRAPAREAVRGRWARSCRTAARW